MHIHTDRPGVPPPGCGGCDAGSYYKAAKKGINTCHSLTQYYSKQSYGVQRLETITKNPIHMTEPTKNSCQELTTSYVTELIEGVLVN